MQQRPAGREHGGLWEYPGGKVEPGEGPVAALVRELHEELAITVNPADFCALGFASREGENGGGTGRPIVLLLYGCRRWQGDPVSQEGAVLDWCPPDTLTARPQPPLDIPLAAAAIGFAARQG